ncbi:Eco57I restriction-modification methylase domain-containing protein [Microbacterium testaceum]|uniref:Eco57I restriction-modification methylase domain-containing protein n=1 Tax=Microbacterium testaceum TaxID=2033 RepID=UPI0025B1D984|nr:Eco57I restriction-modification methylase domain-containing protein [Microbacterium testaceum]WJS89741.1 Eco57I restriction-modification methylase domain-containing protein [Microbacterium testaceum]
MAEMLDLQSDTNLSVLDAGAGAGALSESVLGLVQQPVQLTMVEKDVILADHLAELLSHFDDKLAVGSEVIAGDFIDASIRWRALGTTFSHVIMNPPYERVRGGSTERESLKGAGVVASNLYAAFLWLGMDLLREGGRMVAVVPRSVLSGGQFRLLRQHLLASGSLFRLHHFRSRREIFQRDSVQQEVVVLGMVKGVKVDEVRYSRSSSLGDIPSESLLMPRERFEDAGGDDAILVPSENARAALSPEPILPVGTDVSVGSVVDFRLPEGSLNESSIGVRLFGSELFSAKEQPERWMRVESATSRFVMPPGRYLVVKRISPPETQPRLKHRVVDATSEKFQDGVAFENHVLVVHASGEGLSDEACIFLDESFGADAAQQQIQERTGSTQINAADIRAMRRFAARTEGGMHGG